MSPWQTIATETMAVPPPEPERPPAAGPGDWIRHNLFRSPGDGIVTVVSAAVVVYVIYRAAALRVRHRALGDRPRQPQVVHGRPLSERRAVAHLRRHRPDRLLHRLVAGFVGRRRIVTGRAEPAPPARGGGGLATLGRLWPLLFGVALVLSMTTTAGPWLTVLAAIVAGVVGRLLGPLLPGRSGPFLVLVAIAGFVGLVLLPPRPEARRRRTGAA